MLTSAPTRPSSSAVQRMARRVRLGRRPRLLIAARLTQETKAPPPSSIAPWPTSQLSKCPETTTTSSGLLFPLISAIVLRDVAGGKFCASIYKRTFKVIPVAQLILIKLSDIIIALLSNIPLLNILDSISASSTVMLAVGIFLTFGS